MIAKLFNKIPVKYRPFALLIGLALLLFVFITGLSIISFIKLGTPKVGVDDANIFFVYAKNLAQGHGFVYNVGGERVEGFTSLLWVLVSAIFFNFSAGPEVFLIILNVVFVVITNLIVLFYLYIAQGRRIGWMILVAYLLFLAIVPDYIVWVTLPLMETGLWALLLTATAITVLMVKDVSGLQYSALLAILVSLLLLIRPEGILWGSIFIFLCGLQVLLLSDLRTALKIMVLPLSSYFATLILLTVFRLAYFGYPLPNTYYAKVSPSLGYNLKVGFDYFLAYLNSGFIFALLAFAAIVFFGRDVVRLIDHVRQRSRVPNNTPTILRSFTLGALCITGLLLPILPGGDHFNSFRFYQPVYPLLVLYFLLSLRDIFADRQLAPVTGLFGLLAIIFFAAFTHDVTWSNLNVKDVSIVEEFRIAENGREKGIFVGNLFEPLDSYPSIGTITSGGFKMTYPGEVVDLMGLNNIQMGHSPGLREGTKNHAAFNLDVFYELQPDILARQCNNLDTQYLPGLADDETFYTQYTCVKIKRIGLNGVYETWVRKDFLEELEAIDELKVEILVDGR